MDKEKKGGKGGTGGVHRVVGCGVMIVAIAGIISGLFFLPTKKEYEFQEADSNEVLINPMMGFAPSADYPDAVGESTLVYIDVTFRELEPEEGFFDFSSIEKDNYVTRWKKEGKQAVFRFVCDQPRQKEHMDIPDWLYEKTKDGTFYDLSYGKGYSPDYENPVFIEAHKKAIEALGEHYGNDSFIYFIELGSLGHWGEWHVKSESEIEQFPSENTCEQYVNPYLTAFPRAKLLMRRPFSFVLKNGLGVYNDMAGKKEDTEEWLDWMNHGGIYYDSKDAMELVPVPRIWEKSPIGGELTSSLSRKQLLSNQLEETISLIGKSHMTFLGPSCPSANKELLTYPKGSKELLRQMGYRYGVSKLIYQEGWFGLSATVKIAFTNRGNAPMYEDWPVYLYLLNEQNEVIRKKKVDILLSQVLQNETKWVHIPFSSKEMPQKGQKFAIGIENPEKNCAAVHLDMNTESIEKKYLLMTKE